MATGNSHQSVSLGCGTLILIALIVLFFSRGGGVGDLADEIRDLRKEVRDLKLTIEEQSTQIRALQDSLEKQKVAPAAGKKE